MATDCRVKPLTMGKNAEVTCDADFYTNNGGACTVSLKDFDGKDLLV